MTHEERIEEFKKLFSIGATAGDEKAVLKEHYTMWCLRRIFGAFEFTGMPSEWDRDYFLLHLFIDGRVAVTDTELGIIPLECGVAGINVYNRPNKAVFGNPILGSFERDIYGDDPKTSCALIKLQFDYRGVRDIIDDYSTLLAECTISIKTNLRNAKVAMIGLCSDKKTAATMQTLYELIDNGKPAVFAKSGTISEDNIFFNHVKENFVANDIQQLKERIKDEFLTEIGLNNANTDKRERLITDEVNANNEEIKASVEHWLVNLKDSFDRLYKLYGIDMSCKLRNFDEREGVKNAELENAE